MADFLVLMSDPANILALVSLTILEIILGIDNLIFISIISEKLPSASQNKARLLGIGLALLMRLVLLMFIAKLLLLQKPVITVFEMAFSWRDLIFLIGGLFLIAKATIEIISAIEGEPGHLHSQNTKVATFGLVVAQIVMLDAVFSIDSILTAFGLTQQIPLMIVAIVISMIVMVAAANPLAAFVNRHMSVKILALAFLILIGVVLIADGFHHHIPRGYIYFALGFSLSVQILTLFVSRPKESVVN